MTRTRALGIGAAGALALAAVLTACTPSPEPTVTSTVAETTTAPSPVPTAPPPTPTSGPDAAPACDTIVAPTLVDTLTAEGWTFRAEPFTAGSLTLDGGISCTWGDFTVASDHVQVFGWAPATPAQQEDLRSELLGQGWRLFEESGATYVTESPETAVAKDDQGYGMTYQLGDGWVRLADTKQGLLLVEWPRP